MIITTALAVSTATFAAAWAIERRARHVAEATLADTRRDRDDLERANETLNETLKRKQIEIEVLEEREDYDVVGHLESTVQVTDYNGLPVYTWSMSSPYPTLAEAVRHVPKNR